MTSRQYEQVLQNRGRRNSRLLFSGVIEGRLLRSAMRNLRQRAAVERALEATLPGELLRATSIEGFEQGTLTISASDDGGRAQLQRSIGRLRKQLIGVVPGVRQVRVAPAPQAEARDG